jgi:hypothetical protein
MNDYMRDNKVETVLPQATSAPAESSAKGEPPTAAPAAEEALRKAAPPKAKKTES